MITHKINVNVDFHKNGLLSLCKCALHELMLIYKSNPNAKVIVSINSNLYGNSKMSVYESYFVTPFQKNDKDLIVQVNSLALRHDSCGLHNNFKQAMRYSCSALAHLYFTPLPELALQITKVRDMLGKNPLGIHYRGTDKGSETTVHPYDTYCNQVKTFVDTWHPSAVFMASDEAKAIEAVRSVVPNLIFLDHVRSLEKNTGLSIAWQGFDPYHMGKEAIIDTYVLASCATIISGASNLSDWASILSPNMSHIRLL